MNKPSQLDPITLEILFNALKSVTDETFIALMRSAYSTNIKERRDHSTALVDATGRLIVQAEASLPVHIASMTGTMRYLIEHYGDDLHQGDIFVANDPHEAGGTHLPDINMVTPVFCDGVLLGFICNIAHHADVGGAVPGSMAGGMSEIYQEGLRIPVVRLFSRGQLNGDLFRLLLLNVRVPEERRGDYFAQVAACRLGARRLHEIVEGYGMDTVQQAFQDIVGRTSRRMRDAIAEITDGVYEFQDVMDDDGLGATDIPIALRIEVNGDQIRFDFSGTATQVDGNINVTLNATQSAVCYALKALLDPDIPNNQGVLDIPEIIVEQGSLLNAGFPAPVAARANTCQRVIDVIIGALRDALPDKVIGASNGANTTAVFSGVDPRTNRSYVYLETLGGGSGARASKDGKDGVQVHITNTSNLPVEAIEMEYPLVVESYGLVENSGGAGEYRGGMGLRRVIRPLNHTCDFNGAGERFTHRPWGIFGGRPGASGKFEHVDATGKVSTLANKPMNVRVKAGEKVVIESPGAGGYGASEHRTVERVREDLDSGKFSRAFVKTCYGQILKPE
ncbi:MAG: hydantoinase B/oxoprolinase family protein [Gammaproteobacteria bacterium]|nr:hydantoinase B/oxoprolinase family protein [Gammaproteobacteria bacterium]